MRLREIAPDAYAHDVLPLTAPLWAGRRSFEQYVKQTLEIARSAYGRRNYKTMGLYDGGALVASYKHYERAVRRGLQRFAAIGFGAVFTPEQYRGRGYASIMLGAALDRAREDGFQVAFLFSDIRPQFYSALGFRELPSRRFSLRADALPSVRLDLAHVGDRDWQAVRRVFERWENRRDSAFVRDDAIWSWIALRTAHRSEHGRGLPANLVLRRRGRIAAYVLGVRTPETDAYHVDEFAFSDEAAAAIPALLRGAAGDLRRIGGWLPPDAARRFLPKLTVRKRTAPIFMMAALGAEGAGLIRAIEGERGDFCWATDHV